MTSARCSRTPCACKLTAISGEPAARVSNSSRSASSLSGSAPASQAWLWARLGCGQATCWQRLLMVGNRRLGWWVTSSNTVSPEGSSRLLSRALEALTFIASTGSISTTLRPPNCAVCTTKATNSRTWSTLIGLSASSGSRTKLSGWLPALSSRQDLHAPQASRPWGCWHSRRAIRRSARARLPIPCGPCSR
ncbi:hypothetical protein D3C76_1048470 [compost metagenome]